MQARRARRDTSAGSKDIINYSTPYFNQKFKEKSKNILTKITLSDIIITTSDKVISRPEEVWYG